MNDITIYKERMAKSMTRAEKLFFLDHLDLYTYDTIIDFGGASGLLIYEIQRQYPDLAAQCRFIIVDCNPQMQTEYELKNCTRVISLDSIRKMKLHGRVLLICSSVLHECRLGEVEKIYNFCRDHVSTLVMRDMAYTAFVDSDAYLYEDAFVGNAAYEKICANEDYKKRFLEMLPYCRDKMQDAKQAITHFILKCDYRENWGTEIHENYFSNYVLALCKCLVRNWWQPLFYRAYALPYKKAQAKEEFGFDLPNTHVQIILERPEKENA